MRPPWRAWPALLLAPCLLADPANNDPDAPRELRKLSGDKAAFTCVAVAPDGQRAAAGARDGKVHLWDLPTGKALRQWQGPRDEITVLQFSPDGRRLAIGAKTGQVQLWDPDTGQQVKALEGHRDLILALAFVQNGQFLQTFGGGLDATWRRWEAASGQQREQRRLGSSTAKIYEVGLAPEGKHAVAAYASTLRLWDAAAQEIGKLEGHLGRVTALAFSGDGRQLASGGRDRTVRVWEVATRRELRVYEGHKDAVHCLAWSADGKRVLSGGADHVVRLWDATKGLLHVFEGHTGEVSGVAFCPDGKVAVSSGHDKMVRVWRLPK
jgi:WD40 repeat protein